MLAMTAEKSNEKRAVARKQLNKHATTLESSSTMYVRNTGLSV
jgi:hypothetical protein